MQEIRPPDRKQPHGRIEAFAHGSASRTTLKGARTSADERTENFSNLGSREFKARVLSKRDAQRARSIRHASRRTNQKTHSYEDH